MCFDPIGGQFLPECQCDRPMPKQIQQDGGIVLVCPVLVHSDGGPFWVYPDESWYHKLANATVLNRHPCNPLRLIEVGVLDIGQG